MQNAVARVAILGFALAGNLSAAELNPIVPGTGFDEDYYAAGVPRFNESGRLALYRNSTALVLQDRASGETRRITLPGSSGGSFTLGSPDIDLAGTRISFEYDRGPDAAPAPPGSPSPEGIYVHDRLNGTFLHVSEKPSGSPVLDFSQSRLSGNGKFIVFVSADDDLVPNDTNGVADVFVMRVSDRQITRVSLSSSGTQAIEGSGSPSIDATGTRVAFISADAGLVANDTNGVSDVFVHDVSQGSTRRVSEATGGVQANGPVFQADISDGGNDVAFVSAAANLGGVSTLGERNVYLHSISSSETVLASPIQEPSTPEGSVGAKGVSISADGQSVAFGYSLYPNQTAETGDDNISFVFDRAGSQLARLRGSPYHYGESISPDGSTVGFSEEYDVVQDRSGPPRAYAYDLKPFCDAGDPALQFTLAERQWKTLSLPCELPPGATLDDLFSDDIPGAYEEDWIVYLFDDAEGSLGYRVVPLTSRLEPGQGYWIMSMTGGTRTLTMPAGSRAAESSYFADANCIVPTGCHDRSLRDSASYDGGWNIVGTASAHASGMPVARLRFVTDAGTCSGAGCTFAESSDASRDLLAPVLWHFDGTSYQSVQAADTVLPWQGFWTKTSRLASGTNLSLRVPGGTR